MRLKQQNQGGQQLFSPTRTYGRRHCRRTSGVALCSDDDWGSKCPSGCRLQGLISQMESKVERKLQAVCKRATLYEDAAEKSVTVMKRVYGATRRVFINRHESELKFVELAERLARNLTSLRKRSSRLSLQLGELRGNVQTQLEDLYRMEVDIDIKLRACSGSCRVALPFSVDHLGYRTLHADTERMETKRKAAAPPEDIPRVTLQPVDVEPVLSSEYQTIPTVQREALTQFEDIVQNRVVLEPVGPAELD
ncbi:fibrinogen alpha chain [Plectropomus leopardus]|uniref:fibrinogen alpha chain n=1 Tax=Plectropomus leopardus TaxID=160734 RepID=UPI001C4CDC03|nr:fibrinogen alpha chain [Plectropomus leopardus]